MINENTFQSLILTNTIVAAFCIVLLVTFTVFIILIVIPLIRRHWSNDREKNGSGMVDVPSLNRQALFDHFDLGTSRFNPLFQTTPNATTATQFGTLFHPHGTAATLLHPTVWTSTTPTSVLPSQTSSVPPTTTPTTTPTTPSQKLTKNG